jgi:hypothetical protein
MCQPSNGKWSRTASLNVMIITNYASSSRYRLHDGELEGTWLSSDVLVVTTQGNKNTTDHGLNTFGNLRIGYQFGRISFIMFQNLKNSKISVKFYCS